MENLIFEGKNVDEALEKAVTQLNTQKDELNYEVLEEGSSGFFKVFSKKCKIKVSLNNQNKIKDRINAMFETDSTLEEDSVKDEKIEETLESAIEINNKISEKESVEKIYTKQPQSVSNEELINEAKQFLEEFFNHFDIKIRTDHRVYREKITLLIFTQGNYINSKNFEEFIYSIKYLLNKIMINKHNSNVKFEVDINEYIKKKIIKLKQLAREISEKVKSEHKSIKLRPMYPNERRIVHIALKNDSNIKTESIGNGERKRVIISPASTVRD